MAVETPVAESGTQDTGTEGQATGSTTGTTAGADVSRTEFESKVSDNLAAAFADVSDDDVKSELAANGAGATKEAKEPKYDTEGDDRGTVSEQQEETDKEQENASGEDAGAAEAGKTEAAKPATTPAASTLPAAYVRSLKAMEWTDQEIEQASKTPNFIATAAKLHQTRNRELQEWANIGRAKRADSQAQQGQQSAGLQQLQTIDPAPLKKQYGDDGLIDGLLGPINKTIEQINQIVPVIQQTQQASHNAHLESLGRAIDGFFSDKEISTFADLYGPNEGERTKPQNEARNRVLEMADALIAGAALQNRKFSLDQALRSAHDTVSAGHKAVAVRGQIAASLKKRAGGISLKPAGGKPPASKPGDRSSLVNATAARLAAAFK